MFRVLFYISFLFFPDLPIFVRSPAISKQNLALISSAFPAFVCLWKGK